MAHVLLIDDEEDIRTIAEMSLANLGGMQVSLAENGRDGISKATALVESGSPPDIILLDVMMPDMDGPSTLSQLSATESLNNIPVVFMTAKVMGDEIEKYMQLGAKGVIQKPFDPVSLSDQVMAYLK